MHALPSSKPEMISRFKKERFLRTLSEDDFRDQVVRPLFLRQGLKDGRDMCGPFEKGKDAIFIHQDLLGMMDVYAVQTKKGSLNMSGKSTENVVTAITQLGTALATKIPFLASKTKLLPTKVFLCTSGKINDSARSHIVDEIKDPRLVFLDSDELIPKIDEVMPEVWLGIDVDQLPYLRAIKALVEDPESDQVLADLVSDTSIEDAATDAMFVPLRLHRTALKPKKIKGTVELVPKFEDLPVTGILSRSERLILIIGGAGSGKSTSIKRLAYVLAVRALQSGKNIRIPILLRASEIWDQRQQTLLDVSIAAAARLVHQTSRTSFTTDDLSAGRVVVLIDAFDEVSDDAARVEILRKAREFHDAYPKCQVIVTTRDYSFIETMDEIDDFTKFRLFPIDYKQAQQIIVRFEKKQSLPAEQGKEILRRLQEMHGMELNPLLVTVFAATSDYSRRDIPANITELFKKYTEWMLGRWNAAKNLGQQYHGPLKDFLLKKIAFEVHRRQETSLSFDEFEYLLQTELISRGHKADIAQLTDEILNKSGLFRMFGGRVEFRHHLLQEFFAGRGIPDVAFLESVISEDWWQRAIVFFFGERPGDSAAFYRVMKACESRRIGELYSASLTTGLALQACYLMHTEDKAKILPWVIDGLSKAKELFMKIVDQENKHPLTRFAGYYLLGRDAVACGVITERSAEIEKTVLGSITEQDERDLRKFWILVAKLEVGDLEDVHDELKHFKPKDPRLLLAIHLGAFLIQHHRVADKKQKKAASDICNQLAGTVSHLRKELLREFRSELLEIQKGKVMALEIPKTAEEEQKLLSSGKRTGPVELEI
ncbi:MAG TPA: NACHT domain-containing protein [Chthoniobacterales bacterium]|nr:NACHT domain-containing protein [Chthoniobacterales bacterium]